MTVLSTFLKSSLNFLFRNLRNTTKLDTVREKSVVKNLNCQKHSLKGQSGTKSPVKPIWSEKMTVLSTFLESSLNFLCRNLRNTTKLDTVREKSGVQI